MTSRSEQSFRIRRAVVEPTAAAAQQRLGAGRCPRCGGAAAAERVAGMAPSVAPSAAAAELSDAGAVRGGLVSVLRVVLDQRRPIAQLGGVAAPSVRRYLRAARPASRRVRASRLLSLRLCRPTARAAEAAAVVGIDRRIRAIAARFEHGRAGWCCTAFRIL